MGSDDSFIYFPDLSKSALTIPNDVKSPDSDVI